MASVRRIKLLQARVESSKTRREMKSTFLIETRIRGTATTIKIHSIPTPPIRGLFLLFSFYVRDSGGCVFAHHANVLPLPVKYPRQRRRKEKNERKRENTGDVFSGRVVLYHRKIGIEAAPMNANARVDVKTTL